MHMYDAMIVDSCKTKYEWNQLNELYGHINNVLRIATTCNSPMA